MQQSNQEPNLSDLDTGIMKVIFDDRKRHILEILEKSTDYLSSITEKSGTSHVVCLYHLTALEETGFVHKIDAGYRKFYLLSDRGKRALDVYKSSFKHVLHSSLD